MDTGVNSFLGFILGCIYFISFVLLVIELIWLAFYNELTIKVIENLEVEKFIKNFFLNIFVFVLCISIFIPIRWMFNTSSREYKIEDNPYAVEEIISKPLVGINSYGQGNYTFKTYDSNGFENNRAVLRELTTIYYEDIETPVSKWYNAYSNMVGMKAERIYVELYLPESWRGL